MIEIVQPSLEALTRLIVAGTFPHLSIAVENFSLAVPLRRGSAETRALAHLEHAGHVTCRTCPITAADVAASSLCPPRPLLRD